MVFWSLARIFGIKYGIRNALKISNPLNTKYLVGCIAPPLGDTSYPKGNGFLIKIIIL